jgi:K+-sensing histidine kinase KdpD
MDVNKRRVSTRYLHTLDTVIGLITITAMAVLATVLLYGSQLRFVLPLFFVGIVLLISYRFGTAAGVLGTIISALVFAHFLFIPHSELHILSPQGRDSLNWMLLGGISVSFLFPRRSPQPARRD